MWESPIYKFQVPINGQETEILIDVTGSAPVFSEPGKQLINAFNILLEGLEPANTKILDFGGAKLRNTLYLLQQGYTVYACEFEDLFKRSRQANDFLNECNKFPNFKKLVFPNEFLNFQDEFDVVLLINVLNIMPVPIERYLVLSLCREKIIEQGRLLWYTQHGAYSEDKAVCKLFDGLVTGKGRKYKMFYRDFSRKEIHNMLTANGFNYSKEYKFRGVGNNQSYVFIADGPILVDQTVSPTEQLGKMPIIETEVVTRGSWKTKEDETEPSKRLYETSIPVQETELFEVNLLNTYISELKETPTGIENATKYHRLIFNIVKLIFDNRLKRPQFEEILAEGTQRVDITFRNIREYGFFLQLAEGYDVKCPNIFIECKNYEGDIGNPVFSQIQNRLNKRRGQFGIIICRNIVDLKKSKERQNNLVKDDKYVIILTDSDIEILAKYKINNEEAIDNYLEDKFKGLL